MFLIMKYLNAQTLNDFIYVSDLQEEEPMDKNSKRKLGQLVVIDVNPWRVILEIDVNPWRSLESLEMWTRSLDNWLSC
jgi:hypothetical protein